MKVKVHWPEGKGFMTPDGWSIMCKCETKQGTIEVFEVPFQTEEETIWVHNYLTKGDSLVPLEFDV